ncbi:hypothetical protein [Nocardia vinacea]|uniref:hypothetical protein n=1 Tax=Nocardia vinacea TaxID=96468 RepID=UPI0005948BFE|nr:hypothetical protein [Nocardia vinacea]
MVRADIAAIGTTVKIDLDIEVVQRGTTSGDVGRALQQGHRDTSIAIAMTMPSVVLFAVAEPRVAVIEATTSGNRMVAISQCGRHWQYTEDSVL